MFIIGSPLETAYALDPKRFNKQMIEARQILAALRGDTKAWSNHPCTLMYRDHDRWLYNYLRCLECVRNREYAMASLFSFTASQRRPPFHTEAYFNQMKRRLYTKDRDFYRQWSDLGESDVNWYFVDGEWRFYLSGKRIGKPSGE